MIQLKLAAEALREYRRLTRIYVEQKTEESFQAAHAAWLEYQRLLAGGLDQQQVIQEVVNGRC